MVCLKLDLYQPKYANIPMIWSVTPCQKQHAFVDGYGVGTVFTANNAVGVKEAVKVVEIVPLTRIVYEIDKARMTYNTKQLPNGDCEIHFLMDGPNVGRFQRHYQLQLNTIKAFIEANVAAICKDAPPLEKSAGGNIEANTVNSVPVTVDEVCDWVAAQGVDPGPFREASINQKLLLQMDHEMLEELGCSSKIKRTKLLNAITDLGGGSSSKDDFVAVPQHAQAQQAQQTLFQLSQTQATVKEVQRCNRYNHYNHY